ncbi:MAG: glycoside hydrolase family 97 protein [Chitinophagaceae bacterium]
MKLSTKIPAVLLVFTASLASAQDYQLSSPDKKIAVTVSAAGQLSWSAKYNGEQILLPSSIALTLADGKILADKPSVSKAIPSSVKSVITSPVPVKQRLIPEEYNQLLLQCKGNYSIVFRAYNDGIAYRFVTAFADSVTVVNEKADFNFPDNYQTAWPYDEPFSFGAMRPAPGIPAGFGSANPPATGGMFGPPPAAANTSRGNNAAPGAPAGPPPSFPRMIQNPFTISYEYLFRDSTLAAVKDTVGLPLYMSTAKGVKLVLTESDLYDYPNLFAVGTGKNSVTATLPPYVLKAGGGMGPMSTPSETANYIARTNGKRNYPWRALIISPDDKGLLENKLVYKLASPPAIATDWIEPGQVSWEWWHASNLFDVDFKAGINTASYKYYIDFAAKYGIKYILIDAGWSKNPQVDIPAITSYGKSKNVGVMLWMSWTDLTADMPTILDEFQTWGVKGVKMDYMNRADQKMVNIFESVAQETAKRHMLIDFHGAYKPVGLNRKYPNVVNYEGVKGMEHNKLGSMRITPSHDVTLLFTRMVAGPMDYTPGAMHNVTSGNFKNISSEPMSQGTRAHQAAMYIMYDAPIQMLADNPVLYMREDAYTKFLTQIPTVWDTTIGIDGKIGQYAVMARRNGQRWYLGAMGDWGTRTLDVKTDFLTAGKRYKITIVADGINADHYASDYTLQSTTVTGGDAVKIALMPGGGYAAIIEPAN